MHVWNKIMRPEEHPDFYRRNIRPVTWGDLGNRFHTTALRCFHINDNGYMDRYKEEIKLFTETYDFGDVLWPHISFIFARNFKEVVNYIKEKGLYVFDVWAYAPNSIVSPGYKAVASPQADAHQYLIQTLGDHFLGWDNGEHDGRFFHYFAPMVCPAPRSRREAYEAFAKFFYQLSRDMTDYLNVLLGMYYGHYMVHFGNHRLLGAETAQALPSVPLWYAFIRGAGKQYGILWFGNASVFNAWGYKKYGNIDKRDPLASRGLPEKGTSLELLKRLWYVEYMYGCCLMSYEQSHIEGVESEEMCRRLMGKTGLEAKWEPDHPRLSPIGQLQVACTQWCKQHPDVGVQYTPVAVLMDFYSGWAPARSMYHRPEGKHLVWGSLPYEQGDYQADAFFRLVYPGYVDSGYYRDERGFLTATPVGDIFDVLLSNVGEDVLHRYQAIVVLGGISLAGKLLTKALHALEAGATLIVSAVQLSDEARAALGYRSDNVKRTAAGAVYEGRKYAEAVFQYEVGELSDSKALAVSETGDALILQKGYGRGSLVIVTADYGLNDQPRNDPLPPANAPETPWPVRYDLLHCVQDYLTNCFKALNVIEVTGKPVQYITNVTADPRQFYVMLSNNEKSPWSGTLAVSEARPIQVDDLFSGESVAVADGRFQARVKPLDVSAYRVTAAAPAVSFQEEYRASADPMQSVAVWSRVDGGGSLWSNIELIGRSSFRSVELCATQVLGLNDQELKLLSQELAAGNLGVTALNLTHAQTPFIDGVDLSSIVVWSQADNRKFLARALTVARALACPRIILSAGRIDNDYRKALQITVQNLTEFAREAREYGVNVYLQPCPYRGFGKATELVQLLEKIDLPNVGIALDTGHACLLEDDLLSAVKTCGSHLKYIDLNSPQDVSGSGLIDRHLAPGEGVFDEPAWQGLVKRLKSMNYAGQICLNCYLPNPALAELQRQFRRCERLFGQEVGALGRAEAWSLVKWVGTKAEMFRRKNVLDQYYVAGPFDNADPDGRSLGLNHAFAPEKGVELKATYLGQKGRTITWRRIQNDDLCENGYVNLKYLLGETGHVAAYAYAVLTAKKDTAVTLLAGGDDGFVLWLNGREILRREMSKNSHYGENRDRVLLVLKQGPNELLIKTNMDDARRVAWGFLLSLADHNPDVVIGADQGRE